MNSAESGSPEHARSQRSAESDIAAALAFSPADSASAFGTSVFGEASYSADAFTAAAFARSAFAVPAFGPAASRSYS